MVFASLFSACLAAAPSCETVTPLHSAAFLPSTSPFVTDVDTIFTLGVGSILDETPDGFLTTEYTTKAAAITACDSLRHCWAIAGTPSGSYTVLLGTRCMDLLTHAEQTACYAAVGPPTNEACAPPDSDVNCVIPLYLFHPSPSTINFDSVFRCNSTTIPDDFTIELGTYLDLSAYSAGYPQACGGVGAAGYKTSCTTSGTPPVCTENLPCNSGECIGKNNGACNKHTHANGGLFPGTYTLTPSDASTAVNLIVLPDTAPPPRVGDFGGGAPMDFLDEILGCFNKTYSQCFPSEEMSDDGKLFTVYTDDWMDRCCVPDGSRFTIHSDEICDGKDRNHCYKSRATAYPLDYRETGNKRDPQTLVEIINRANTFCKFNSDGTMASDMYDKVCTFVGNFTNRMTMSAATIEANFDLLFDYTVPKPTPNSLYDVHFIVTDHFGTTSRTTRQVMFTTRSAGTPDDDDDVVETPSKETGLIVGVSLAGVVLLFLFWYCDVWQKMRDLLCRCGGEKTKTNASANYAGFL